MENRLSEKERLGLEEVFSCIHVYEQKKIKSLVLNYSIKLYFYFKAVAVKLRRRKAFLVVFRKNINKIALKWGNRRII